MKFEFSITIPAPREVVWQVAQNADFRPRWDHRVARYIVHGQARAGCPVTIVLRAGGLRPALSATLTRFEPPSQSILRLANHDSKLLPTGGGTWMFADTEGGTQFTTRFNLKFGDLLPAPDWLVSRIVALDTKRSLKKLSALCVDVAQTDDKYILKP